MTRVEGESAGRTHLEAAVAALRGIASAKRSEEMKTLLRDCDRRLGR